MSAKSQQRERERAAKLMSGGHRERRCAYQDYRRVEAAHGPDAARQWILDRMAKPPANRMA